MHCARTVSARLIGWGLTILAFCVGYLIWIIGRQWWWPSVIVGGAILIAICAFTCRLAYRTRKYDLYLAGILSLLAPAIVIFVSFGFFFSEAQP